jgi:hypothetical protein
MTPTPPTITTRARPISHGRTPDPALPLALLPRRPLAPVLVFFLVEDLLKRLKAVFPLAEGWPGLPCPNDQHR